MNDTQKSARGFTPDERGADEARIVELVKRAAS